MSGLAEPCPLIWFLLKVLLPEVTMSGLAEPFLLMSVMRLLLKV